MFRIAALLLLALVSLVRCQDVSTASDYARVREILHEYYSTAAKAYGHDYDPDAVQTDVTKQRCDENNEVCANKRYWGDLFENDIVLTLPQAENLLNENSGRRGKRQAQPTADSFWKTLTVPYIFGFQDSTWQTLIRSALRHVESETCIRFSENGSGADRLMYIRGSGCWSNVGRIGGTQQVSIGYGCDALGIVAHETLHALGLWHEQSRTDRDNHIFINPSAIIRGTEGNFQKRTPQTSDNMGQPYDLGSVMHYSAKSFSNDYTQATISTRDPRYQHTIGQREAISFKDAKMINLRYCDRVCSRKLSCANGGYTDPNNCGQCKCPNGYGGTYCNQVQRTSCGGELLASSSQQSLNSGNVYAGTHCVWRIRSPAGQKLELDVQRVNFVCRETCSSYVEIKYAQNKETAGARLCCDAQKTLILSEDDEVVLIFKGEDDLQPGYLGFELKYRYYGSATTTPAPPTTTTVTTTTTTTQRPTTRYWPPTTTRLPAPVGLWSQWSEWSRCSEPCGGCGRRRRVRVCVGGDNGCNGFDSQIQPCNSHVCIGGKKGHVCSGRVLIPCDLARQLHFGTTQQQDSPPQTPPQPPLPGIPPLTLPTLPPLRGPQSSLLPIPRIAPEAQPPAAASYQTGPPAYAQPAGYVQPRYRRAADLSAALGESLPQPTTHTGARSARQANNSQLCEKRFQYYCPSRLLTIHIDWLKAMDAIPAHNDSPQCCTGYYASDGKCYKNE